LAVTQPVFCTTRQNRNAGSVALPIGTKHWSQ